MDTTSKDFWNQLFETFQVEAEEHYKAIVDGLLALEQTATLEEQAPLLETVFREAHSLKGAARAVNLTDLEAVCQSLEGVFTCLKRKVLFLSTGMLDTLHRALDTVEALLTIPEGRHAARVAETVDDLTRLEEEGHLNGSAPKTDVVEGTPPAIEPSFAQNRDQLVAVEVSLGDNATQATPVEGDGVESLVVPAAHDDRMLSEAPAPPACSAPSALAPNLLDELFAAFQVEAEELLRAMQTSLLELEHGSTSEEQQSLIETTFRNAHSLKGAARAVNLTDLEPVCQALESVLACLKRQELALSPTVLDTLYQTLDTVETVLTSPHDQHVPQIAEAVQALDCLKAGKRPATAPVRREGAEITPLGVSPSPRDATPPETLTAVTQSCTKGAASVGPVKTNGTPRLAPVVSQVSTGSQSEAPPAHPRPTTETIRISTAKLDSLFLQAEELLVAKYAAGERVAELRDVLFMLAQWKKEWSRTAPDVRKVQQIYEGSTAQERRAHSHLSLAAKLVEFLYWNEYQFTTLENKLKVLAHSTERDYQEVGTMVNNLLDDTKKVLMQPASSLLDVFPKMVRDISRTLGKEVELTTRGGEVEIDKRILEELKDPLIHLLRNSIDHGIELPDVRVQRGKPRRGTLVLAVSQVSGNTAEVLVADDGAGIDSVAVKQAAVKRGVMAVQEAETLDEQAALALIFQSDVSTSPIVTDLSGRGLGMAIVREKVEQLGGHISIDTQRRQGTTFRILLPLTLATFRGIFVQAAGQTFVLPTASVERVVRIRRDEIKIVENKETLLLRERPIALARLDAILGLPQKVQHDDGEEWTLALVLGTAEKRVAFCVDKVLSEQEVLFKDLGSYLSAIPHVAGTTLLGSGKVVPILHVPDLLRSAVTGATTRTRATRTIIEGKAKQYSILLAEDSVTSRILLKGILESAGYQVKTTIDGVDAFTTLKRGHFDLVVSDVEMPRLNGFDLTAKIRSDEQYSQVPIVLVTGLESLEDRERGIQVGANTYIVKSDFDHSNLLSVIHRLI